MSLVIQVDNTNIFHFTFRKNRKLHKLDFAASTQAEAALGVKPTLLLTRKAIFADENKIEQNLDRLTELVDKIVEESLICQGMVRRKGVFQVVSRLNMPLPIEERSHIRRVKFNAKPQSFQELQSKVTPFQN